MLVAVPVKDEIERIAACPRALALQKEARVDGIVLVINNTIDGTAEVVRALLPVLPVPVHIVERWFPPERASAGGRGETARGDGRSHAPARSFARQGSPPPSSNRNF